MERSADIRSAVRKAVKQVNRTSPGSVIAAYLHGSYARGGADTESDIDIGFLAGPALGKKQRFDLRLQLLSTIDELLPMRLADKLDVTILQDVPVLLQFNVVRGSIILFEANRSERLGYELHVEQAYDDERYYLEREAEATLRHIISRPAA